MKQKLRLPGKISTLTYGCSGFPKWFSPPRGCERSSRHAAPEKPHKISSLCQYKLICLYRVVWCGVVWCGVVWCGVVWCGVVWCGVVWCGVVWYGMVWYGMVWYGMVWYGMHHNHFLNIPCILLQWYKILFLDLCEAFPPMI